jgi:hypothetical protein
MADIKETCPSQIIIIPWSHYLAKFNKYFQRNHQVPCAMLRWLGAKVGRKEIFGDCWILRGTIHPSVSTVSRLK